MEQGYLQEGKLKLKLVILLFLNGKDGEKHLGHILSCSFNRDTCKLQIFGRLTDLKSTYANHCAKNIDQ